MKILIRQATIKDANSIIRCNKLMALETENIILNNKKAKDGVSNFFKRKDLGFYLIAEVDGKAVGQLMITYEWSDWRNGIFFWIQSVYVEKKYRGKKIFSLLFEHVSNMAKEKKDVCGLRLYVENSNLHAQKVYKKLGMKKLHYKIFETAFIPV